MMAHDERPYEDRFFAQPPPRTNAQAAATRVYNKNGILVRSDPFVAAADRHGKAFPKTKWHEMQTEATPQHSQRAARIGSKASASKESADPASAFRRKVLERGGSGGIHLLNRIFRIMEDDGRRNIDVEEVKAGLRDYGVMMAKGEVEGLIDFIGRGRPITFKQFVVAIRGEPVQRRMKRIDDVFTAIDRSGSGVVTVDDVQDRFRERFHADALTGRVQPEDAFTNFLSMFDGLESDGVISRNEFIEYYKNISASIEDDDFFDLMMCSAWEVPGSGRGGGGANIRLFVVFNDGTQRIVPLQGSPRLDLNDSTSVMRALRERGVTDVAKFTVASDI